MVGKHRSVPNFPGTQVVCVFGLLPNRREVTLHFKHGVHNIGLLIHSGLALPPAQDDEVLLPQEIDLQHEHVVIACFESSKCHAFLLAHRFVEARCPRPHVIFYRPTGCGFYYICTDGVAMSQQILF